MKNHTKVYFKHFGYALDEFIPCEICEARAVDIHHIERRGMGGTSKADEIENLMALCRQCHVEYGDKKQYMGYLENTHRETLEKHKELNRAQGKY